MQTIKEFNQELVNKNENIILYEYITRVNDLFYHIDIDFMVDFMGLVDKDDFIIQHDMLQKYGVLTIKDSYCVKRLLDQYDFVDEKDYTTVPLKSGGKIEYNLKPDTF